MSAYEICVNCKAGIEDESVRAICCLPAQNGMMSGDIALNCKSLFQSHFTLHRVASLQRGYFIFIKNSLCMSGLLHREKWEMEAKREWWGVMVVEVHQGEGSLAALNDQDMDRFCSI